MVVPFTILESYPGKKNPKNIKRTTLISLKLSVLQPIISSSFHSHRTTRHVPCSYSWRFPRNGTTNLRKEPNQSRQLGERHVIRLFFQIVSKIEPIPFLAALRQCLSLCRYPNISNRTHRTRGAGNAYMESQR